ncbi:MAG: hypothetical protein EON85_09940 [Brevundimonas sp.]|nr:MAG: hypothetical protein EON85_09940 [Brevundimonas sp.]
MVGIGPNGRRVLEAVILAMADLVASMGVTFGCLLRNMILWPAQYAHHFGASAPAGSAELHGRMPGTSMLDMAMTVVCALLMLVWIWAFVSFVRREPRSPITWVPGSLIGAGFIWFCWQNWLMAYPVCNSF